MLGLELIDILVLVSYFVVVIAIGVISTRLIKNREDFLLGGRRFGKILMIFFTFGSGTHADNAVGVAAQSYKMGLAGIWYQWVMLLTLPITWLLAPVFRRARVLTTADFFERRFGSWFSVLYSAFGLFICITLTSQMLFGSAQLLESLINHQFSWKWIILAVSLISFFYAIAGGLIAAVWNDFFQGILTIVMSVLLIPFFWSHIGGLEGFQSKFAGDTNVFDLVLSKDMTLFWILMMSINSMASMVAQPHIMSNAGAGKSEMDSRIGFLGGLTLKRIITIPWALTGIMALALYGEGTINPDHTFGKIASDLLPAGFTGLMLACVLASVMDNAAVAMLSFAGLYSNNIHRKMWPSVDEKKMLKVNRLASVSFAAVSVPLAYAFTDVPGSMRFTWNTIPLMGIPFFLGLVWRRANRYGALAGFLCGLVAMLIGNYYLEWRGDAGLPKNILLFLSTGILGGIVVSLLTPPEPKTELDRFYLLMNTPIGEEEKLAGSGLVEVPGTGTYEVDPAAQTREIQVDQDRLIGEIPKPGGASLWGAIILVGVVFGMLGFMIVFADWLKG